MEPFIRNDQYNFIASQAANLVNGHASVNDPAVLQALQSLAKERIFGLFPNRTEEQHQILSPIVSIQEKADAEAALAELKQYVIPFKQVTEQSLKKLFPKVKKLKTAFLKEVEWREISYLSWEDIGANKKFLIASYGNKLIGLQGTFNPAQQKSICAICHQYEEVGLFISAVKGADKGTYIRRGNYICQNPQTCNHNIRSLDKLHEFIERSK
ncbi:FusB/FusC family EF-G-binding protein [Bacillus xiapuensis]|uniref:FusB/FusC family EF-G-binding protein n=1 Tax=Bacillus xiapuensis TaxID=2014075 RepID=UPI000C231283|nr:FusB/FusC family EF-G-binding protein [Bacillus xiapuensis]